MKAVRYICKSLLLILITIIPIACEDPTEDENRSPQSDKLIKRILMNTGDYYLFYYDDQKDLQQLDYYDKFDELIYSGSLTYTDESLIITRSFEDRKSEEYTYLLNNDNYIVSHSKQLGSESYDMINTYNTEGFLTHTIETILSTYNSDEEEEIVYFDEYDHTYSDNNLSYTKLYHRYYDEYNFTVEYKNSYTNSINKTSLEFSYYFSSNQFILSAIGVLGKASKNLISKSEMMYDNDGTNLITEYSYKLDNDGYVTFVQKKTKEIESEFYHSSSYCIISYY